MTEIIHIWRYTKNYLNKNSLTDWFPGRGGKPDAGHKKADEDLPEPASAQL